MSRIDIDTVDIERNGVSLRVERDTKEACEIALIAESFEIATPEDASVAQGWLNEIVRRRKSVEDWFSPMVKSADRAHKEATAKRNEALAPIVEAEDFVRGKLSAYASSIERIDAKDAGLKTREAWGWTLDDKAAFVRAALEDPTLLAMLTIDGKAMSGFIRALKGAVQIAGVTIESRRVAVAS